MKTQENLPMPPPVPLAWLAGGFADWQHREPSRDGPTREARDGEPTLPNAPTAIWPRVFPGL